jgi:single-stranded-DNA-specific exonuclease
LTASILWQRGLQDPDAAQAFFDPAGTRITSGTDLPGAMAAGARLARAIREREPVVIFGDYDVDGISAAALVCEFVQDRGGICRVVLPDRLADGYGLTLHRLQQLHAENCHLLFSVDCGISSHAEVAWANEHGLEVVITDHHEPGALLPPARIIVDPKLSGPERLRGLAGVGVAFLVARSAADALGDREPESLRKYLDLVALGTIADVVPLFGENRTLTRAGLAVINRKSRRGLLALAAAAGLGTEPVGAQDVAFRLAPRLNAAGRLGDARRGLELLLTKDPGEAERLASVLQQENTRRQSLEQTVLAQALEQVEKLPELPWALALYQPDWPLGVLGLAASRLCERYHRPCFVGSLHHGAIRASGRSIPGFSLHAVLNKLAPMLCQWGGHELAAGVSLRPEAFPGFAEAINAAAHRDLQPEHFEPELTIDAAIGLGELTPRLVEELKRLEPFGFGNAQPMLAATHVSLGSPPRVVGERHLKLKLQDDKGRWLDAIGFGLGARAGELKCGEALDVAGTVSENTWNGNTRLQMEVKDFRPTAGK